MSASDTALLVIDVQESFRQLPVWREEDVPAFAAQLQALIDGAGAQGIPVVQIFHVDEDAPFNEESGHVKTLAPIAIAPDVVFHKHRHSALVGSGLDVWLTSNGIRRLLVSGIRTEQCCETTTRHASDLGYEVDFVSAATLTNDLTDAAGRRWSPAELKARTEAVLAGRFARIATVAEALAGSSERKAA
jgi:nicotinamidase-related amidase